MAIGSTSCPAFADERQTEIAELAERFARPDTYLMPALSPSGRYLAVLETRDAAKVAVFDLIDAEQPKKVFEVIGHKIGSEPLLPELYNRILWLDDSRLFLDLVHHFRRGDCRVAYRCVQYPDSKFKVIDLEARKILEPFRKAFSSMGDQTIVVHWPEQENEPLVLALRQDKNRSPDVYEVDQGTLRVSKILDNMPYTWNWMTDRAGELRIYWEHPPSENDKVFYRLSGEKKWVRLRAAEPEVGKTFDIASFSNDPNKIYVASNHEGEPSALYLFDLETQSFGEKIASHERYDISGMTFLPNGEIETISAGDTWAYEADSHRDVREAIGQIAEGNRLAYFGRDYADNRRIYGVSASDDPGAFYLFDRSRDEGDEVVSLMARKLSEDAEGYSKVHPVTITAPDGLELEGFLSLPPGMYPADKAPVPFVVMPHGGPWSRDFAVFDPLGQFINSLGVGVIKVNFRGSAGYGAEFEEMGTGEWGRAMQDDLNAARQFVIDEGLTTPDNVCMVGWSYGGYASLRAAMRDGDKYKCAASIAGVTDISALLRSDPGDEILRRLGAKSQFDHGAVREISPLQQVEDLSIPILLAHGTADRTVPYEDQYLPFLKRAKKEGKEIDYIAFKYGDHSLSSALDRQILYLKLGLFLDEHLNPEG